MLNLNWQLNSTFAQTASMMCVIDRDGITGNGLIIYELKLSFNLSGIQLFIKELHW